MLYDRTLQERAQAHYPFNPNYQAAWLRSVAFLGPKWLLYAPQTRPKTTQPT